MSLSNYNDIEKLISNIEMEWKNLFTINEKMAFDIKFDKEKVQDKNFLEETLEQLNRALKFREEYKAQLERIKQILMSNPNNDLQESYSSWEKKCQDYIGFFENYLCEEYQYENTDTYLETKDIDQKKIGIKVKGMPESILIKYKDDLFIKNIINTEKGDYTYELYKYINRYDDITNEFKKIEKMVKLVTKEIININEYKELIYTEFKSNIINKQIENGFKLPFKLKDELRDWQKEAHDAWIDNDLKGIFKVATGCGKTTFALHCIEFLKEKDEELDARIVVPSIQLMTQWWDKLLNDLNVPKRMIARKGGNLFCDEDRAVTIYVNKTALNDEKGLSIDIEVSENKQLIIADECHHYGSKNNLEMFDEIQDIIDGDEYYSVGLSATPERALKSENEKLNRFLGNIIYEYDIVRALGENMVSPFTIDNIECDFLSEEYDEYRKINYNYNKYKGELVELLEESEQSKNFMVHRAYKILQDKKYRKILNRIKKEKDKRIKHFGEKAGKYEFEEWIRENFDTPERIAYTASQLTNYHQLRKDAICSAKGRYKKLESVLNNLNDKKIIIFALSINETENIFDKLKRVYGENVVIYHSEIKPESLKSKNLDDFSKGNAKIMCAVKSLDEGLDIDDIEIGIIYQGEQDERQQIQRLGRIIRKYKNSNLVKNAVLYNIYIPKAKEKKFLEQYFSRLRNTRDNLDSDKKEIYDNGFSKITFI